MKTRRHGGEGGDSNTLKSWCRRRDSNPRPPHYECDALPTELLRPRWALAAGLQPAEWNVPLGTRAIQSSPQFRPLAINCLTNDVLYRLSYCGFGARTRGTQAKWVRCA